jgi:hypothetical protein
MDVATTAINPSDIIFSEDVYKEETLRNVMNDLLKISGNGVCVECKATGNSDFILIL